MKQLYLKVVDKLDTKKLGIVVGILFAISLLPIIYVGLHNYASGDDYWYGIYTYRGFVEGGILGALKGSLRMVAEFYQNWQGTWFTMFLFTLSPNHFWEDGYRIVVFISLGCIIGSIAYLANYYLIKKLGFTKGATTVIVCLISYLALQYIPRTTSGIYWFNGIMHYSIPFLLATLAIVHSHKFIECKKKSDYIILFICFALLGGGSYLAPLAATLAVVLMLMSQVRVEEFCIKNRRFHFLYDWQNLWILLAFLAELIGLVISFAAPGNNVRGGEEFGADLKWALQCIYYAIDRGIYLGEDYFLKNAVTTVVFIQLAILIWNQLWRCDREKIKFRFPLLFVIYMNGIYWATYTPEIYSRSDVSGGVPNTYFHVFLLITFANMIYVHGWVQDQLVKYWKKKADCSGEEFVKLRENSIWYCKKYKAYIEVPVAAVGIILFLLASEYSGLITTNDYCMKCITDGTLERYAQVRKEQHEILMNSEDMNVVIPEIDAPYPLLHMELSEDAGFYRNTDRAKYYAKNSIVAERIE